MEALLAVAEDAGFQQPYPQTHAFNVLTALYQDKQLSTETSPFVARGQHKAPTISKPPPRIPQISF